jgi:lipopolysaccharide/colanic/teichoic acid biosynthesis glycosyltransferase
MKIWNLLKNILNPVDVLSILFAFQCAYSINYFEHGGFFYNDITILKLFICILPFWLMVLFLVKVTGITTKRYKVLFFLYLQSSISIFFLLTLFYFLLSLNSIPKLVLAELSFFGFFFLFFGRIMIYKILKGLGVKGYNSVNIIIVADSFSLSYIENLLSKKELGYKVIVIFTESVIIKEKFENNAIILPEIFLGILNDLIEVDFIDEVLYLKEKTDSTKVREILRSCEDLGVTLRLKCKDAKVKLSSAVRTDIENGKFLSFINIPNNTYALAIKKTVDINLALLMIVVLSPFLIIFSILIKLTSRGPLIREIVKTGWRGRQIKVYRFRTMLSNNDNQAASSEPEMKNDCIDTDFKDDVRFTAIGRFLFKSGLDQLPQLFNVLKGEMPIISQRHPLQSDTVKLR